VTDPRAALPRERVGPSNVFRRVALFGAVRLVAVGLGFLGVWLALR
jgi:hypothetical protein